MYRGHHLENEVNTSMLTSHHKLLSGTMLKAGTKQPQQCFDFKSRCQYGIQLGGLYNDDEFDA